MDTKLRSWLVENLADENTLGEMEKLGILNIQDAYDRASPELLIWLVTREGVATRRQRVEFVLSCIRQIEAKLIYPNSRAVIPAIEGWLSGTITSEDMICIQESAYREYDEAVCAYNSEAVNPYLRNLYIDAAYAAYEAVMNIGACREIYWASVYAAYSISRTAEDCYAVYNSARSVQADWIRKNIPFESLNLGVGENE